MRNRGVLTGALLALGLMTLAGCDNTQGTAANPEMLHETTAYTDNNNPQNTGAGAGVMLKPELPPADMKGGDSPSQAQVKGTDNANGAFPSSLTGPGSGTTIAPTHPNSPSASGTAPTPATAGSGAGAPGSGNAATSLDGAATTAGAGAGAPGSGNTATSPTGAPGTGNTP